MTAVGPHRHVLVASAVIAGAVVLLAVALTRGSARTARCHNSLVPAYVSARALSGLVASSAPPRLVIMNPHNGPGAEPYPAFRAALPAARRAGVQMLGYVHTRYGTRPAADVVADVQRYRDWYGVDGIFFDEAASDADHLGYFAELARRARAAGVRFIVLNPGVVPARGYFDVADVVVTYEGPYAGYDEAVAHPPAWLGRLPATATAHLIYGATSDQALRAVAANRAGHVYATSGQLPNPWATLPDYLGQEEEAVAACT